MAGRFIVFEGGEASGKTTQAERLAAELGAVLTREPGGTAVGKRLRELLLDPALPALSARAEVLLMLADRAQHVANLIEPALAAGRDVVCDRFGGSLVAYQGYGRGLDPGELIELNAWATVGREPDVVILLTVDPEEAAARLAGRSGPDRFEGEGASFFARVAEGYRAQADADPARWRVVDGGGAVEDVAARVRATLALA